MGKKKKEKEEGCGTRPDLIGITRARPDQTGEPPPGSWVAYVDLNILPPGTRYQICTVINTPFGADSTRVGWTALMIYISPVTLMSRKQPAERSGGRWSYVLS